MKYNIIAVGISSGFALTFFGNTHYGIEDLSIMRSIPNLIILSPSDAGQAVKAMIKSIETDKPIYLRLTGQLNCPIVYEKDYEYVIGKGIQLKEGDDIAIIATGIMVSEAMKSSLILEEMGYSISVIDMHTIKPLDQSIIKKNLNSSLIVSIEEHNIIGGLGTAISEYLSSKKKSPPLLRLGIEDRFSNPGNYEHLLRENRLVSDLIVEDIIDKLEAI